MGTIQKAEWGLTYLDLLTGLSILGLLLVISIPRGTNLYTRKTLIREARLLATNLDHLSQLAHITASKTYFKKISTGYRGEDNQNRLLFIRNLPPGFTLTITNNPQLITLFPKGTTTPTTALLTKSGFKCRVVLSLRGRSQVLC
jgi:Tfp pilus assembly protein PilE